MVEGVLIRPSSRRMTGVTGHTGRLKMTIQAIGWLLSAGATRAMTARARTRTWSNS